MPGKLRAEPFPLYRIIPGLPVQPCRNRHVQLAALGSVELVVQVLLKQVVCEAIEGALPAVRS